MKILVQVKRDTKEILEEARGREGIRRGRRGIGRRQDPRSEKTPRGGRILQDAETGLREGGGI
jgi:hypothetical protein